MTTEQCNAPINIDTSSTLIKPTSERITFNYYAGNCAAIRKANNITIEYEIADLPNHIKYKNENYTLKLCKLYKKSIHQINGSHFAAELILWHQHALTNANLLVCIPVSISLEGKTNFGTLIPSETNSKTMVANFDSLKKFIPSGDFYSYSASNFTNCNSSAKVEYIVFPSSNVSVSQTELNNIPSRIPYPIITNSAAVVYKHTSQNAGGSVIKFSDDNVFIDCQPIDAPEYGDTVMPATLVSTPGINFSRLKHNKFIHMLLVFIVFMIVMVIFFYSYEFTTGMFRELTKSVGKMSQSVS
jgi:carbonic anhydrase